MKRILILLLLFLSCSIAVKAESSNTHLKILRINYVGMIPSFSKDIKQYYYVTDNDIQNLQIEAVPENENAVVTIEGNKTLKMGNNTVIIKVNLDNQESRYFINVTKTNNIELANTNLETLAVRQGILEPEFSNDVLSYKVEVGSDVDKIDLLAIPQSMNATVQINGNKNLKIGDNEVKINVLAEDGTTKKRYTLIVHRKSEEELNLAQENQNYQADRVSTIIEKNSNKSNPRKVAILIGCIGILLLLVILLKVIASTK